MVANRTGNLARRFIMTVLDSIPETGQHFETLDLRFEVVDMDGKRVDKILVTPLITTGLEDSDDILVE